MLLAKMLVTNSLRIRTRTEKSSNAPTGTFILIIIFHTFILARRSRKPTKPKLYSFEKYVHFFILKLSNSKSDTNMFSNSEWDCTTTMTRRSLALLEVGLQLPSKQETCKCISRKWQNSGSSKQRFNNPLKCSNRFRRLQSRQDLPLQRFSSL